MAAVVCAACVPLFSGCNIKVNYELKTDDSGNKYYSVRCTGSSFSESEYVIPEYYGEGETYAPVTEVADQGFSATSFTKITIPKTIKKLGVAAFSYNNYLKSVEFAEGCELEFIEQSVFAQCDHLEEVNLPKTVKEIGVLSFYNCAKLKSIDLSTVDAIYTAAFYGCTALQSATFSNTLETIGDMAFCYTGLTSVVIPDSVHDIVKPDNDENGVQKKDEEGNLLWYTLYGIGTAAFYGCKNMTYAVVGEGAETITKGAFGECTKLETLYLPAGLKEVMGALYSEADRRYLFGHAFCNVPLKDLYYGGTPEQWEELKTHIENKKISQNDITSDNSALFNENLVIHFNEKFTGN